MMCLFQTKRLNVNYLKESDLDLFYDMQSNFKVMKFVKPEMNWEESRKELKRFIDYYTKPTINFNIWAVRELQTDLLIGICGIYENVRTEYEIAYRLREKFWRLGYGREIAKGLIRYGFEQMHLDKLIAYVREGNKGSIRILEEEMKCERELFTENGHKEYLYSLKREDWRVE